MLRALPFSLAFHLLVALAAALFGSYVAPPRLDRQVIRVRLADAPRPDRSPQQAPAPQPRPEPRPEPQPSPAATPPPQPEPRKLPKPDTKAEAPAATKPAAPKAPAPQLRPEPQQSSPPAAAAPSGEPTIGGTDQPFPFDWYTAIVKSRIDRNYNPTQLGLGGQSQRIAVIHFFIESNGAVTSATVAQSSGITVLDREALRAVQAAHPLPPLPRGFPGSRLGITFIFATRSELP